MWLKLVGFKILFIGLFLIGSSVFQTAAGETIVQATQAPVAKFEMTDNVPIVSALSYAVFDVETQTVLLEERATEVHPIASVAKLFAAASVLDLKQNQTPLTLTTGDTAAFGHAGRLRAGEVYTSYELLFPLLLESSNDAAAALERAGTGDLVALMNQSVRAAGARATSFADASGLSPFNVSSAAELATLTQALYSTEPHLFDITRLNQRLGEYVGWTNNSPVRDTRYLGGKHGYTEAAGRTLVALFNESLAGGEERVLGYVLLGSADLAADVASLRQYVSESVRLE